MTKYFKSLLVALAISFQTVPLCSHAAFINSVIVGNAEGQLRVVNGADAGLFGTLVSDSGFGTITGVDTQSDNTIVVSNSGGSGDGRNIYRRDPDTLVGLTGDTVGPITAMTVRNDDTVFIAGDLGGAGRISVRSANLLGDVANGPQGGFGTVAANAVGIQSDNRVVLGNMEVGGFDMFRRDANDLDTGLADNNYGVVKAIAIQSNDQVAVGIGPGGTNAGTVFLRQPDVANGVTSDGGFGSIVEFDVMSGSNNIVVANSAGDVWVRNASLAGIASGTGYGTISAIALQTDNDIIVGNTAGELRLLRVNGASLDTIVGPISGFGTITDLAVITSTGIPTPTPQAFENFDDGPSATAHGWTGSGDTSGNNNYGFSPTDHTYINDGSFDGEAGGAISSRTADPTYYADTTGVGPLSQQQTLSASGRLTSVGSLTGFDGGFEIGWFDPSATWDAPLPAIGGPNEAVAMRIADVNGTQYRVQARWDENAGIFVVLNTDTDYLFDLNYDPNGGGFGTGRLDVTIRLASDNSTVGTTTALGNSTGSPFNLSAFGIYTLDFDANSPAANWFIDNLSYTVIPEPSSLVLFASATTIGLLIIRRNRPKNYSC